MAIIRNDIWISDARRRRSAIGVKCEVQISGWLSARTNNQGFGSPPGIPRCHAKAEPASRRSPTDAGCVSACTFRSDVRVDPSMPNVSAVVRGYDASSNRNSPCAGSRAGTNVASVHGNPSAASTACAIASLPLGWVHTSAGDGHCGRQFSGGRPVGPGALARRSFETGICAKAPELVPASGRHRPGSMAAARTLRSSSIRWPIASTGR